MLMPFAIRVWKRIFRQFHIIYMSIKESPYKHGEIDLFVPKGCPFVWPFGIRSLDTTLVNSAEDTHVIACRCGKIFHCNLPPIDPNAPLKMTMRNFRYKNGLLEEF